MVGPALFAHGGSARPKSKGNPMRFDEMKPTLSPEMATWFREQSATQAPRTLATRSASTRSTTRSTSNRRATLARAARLADEARRAEAAAAFDAFA